MLIIKEIVFTDDGEVIKEASLNDLPPVYHFDLNHLADIAQAERIIYEPSDGGKRQIIKDRGTEKKS